MASGSSDFIARRGAGFTTTLRSEGHEPARIGHQSGDAEVASSNHRRVDRMYLPAFSVVVVAVGLVGLGWSNNWGGSKFSDSMNQMRIVVVGPMSISIVAVILVVERLRPAQLRPILARGYRQDALYALLNASFVVPLVVALSLSLTDIALQYLPWIVIPRFGLVPRWAAITLIFVLMDGCNWLAHLANHRFRILWRFHELHHSQEDMSVLTVFRTHPLIHVSYLIALIPGIVLVANGIVPTALLVAYAGFVALEHSNINLGFGLLERIVVSPNYHRIHHKLDGPHDVNLGFALTIWDQLFHRAVFPTEQTVRTDTGLPGRPLVVEQSTVRPRHLSVLVAQLMGPFRPLDDGGDAIRPLEEANVTAADPGAVRP